VQVLLQIQHILAQLHHYNADDKETLWIWDTLQESKFTERIFSVMTFFFGAIILLTLVLDGIVVLNILLVADTERTRELGIREALGARSSDLPSPACRPVVSVAASASRDGDVETVGDAVPSLKSVIAESDGGFRFKFGPKLVNI
jgi:hypothetical protein